MKKKGLLSTVAYLTLSLCLCGGMIAYTGTADVADPAEKIARIEIEDVVEGPGFVIEIPEEEVPLGAPKITTKVTTKTSTTKTNMAKAATKTSKTTTKNTKKTTKTTKSAVKKTVVETTVLTTKVTSTTKKSKVKTVKTTVKTTTKTTETQLAVAAPTNTTQAFTINSFADMNGKIDAKVYNAFNKLGFKYIYDTSISSTGVFSIKNHWIKLKVNNGFYMMHELGHFLSALKGGADSTTEWKNIHAAEKANYTGSNKAYVTSTAAEYFAESYRDYTVEPAKLQQERPQTYAYMKRMVTSLTDKEVTDFGDTYSIFW